MVPGIGQVQQNPFWPHPQPVQDNPLPQLQLNNENQENQDELLEEEEIEMILHDSDDELENLPLMQEAVDDQEGQIRLSLQMDQSNIASFDDSGHSTIRGANILDMNIPIGGFDLEPQVQLPPMDMNAPPELG